MSLGFSLGDFVTTIELTKKIRRNFVDAPSQFKDISEELRSLSIVLSDVDVVLLERELNREQRNDLKDVTDGCRNVLDKLEKALDKYRELKSDPKTVGQNMKRAWKRLKWEPEDIQELRSRISSNIALLNAFNGRLNRANVIELVRHKDDQERQVILDWLSPVDYAAQQSDFICRRQAGTGLWILDSTEFQEWLKTAKNTLFCPGIPGAGKTIITSIVIEELGVRFQNDVGVGIAYLYCDFRRTHEQKVEDLLTSLLKQFVQEQPSVPDSVKLLYNRHKDKRTRPLFEEISKVLHSVTATYSRVFIIIDALDECQTIDGCRTRLLSEIFELQAWNGANIFATSRFIPEILEKFERSVSLEIRASSEDVRTYLDGRMLQLPGFVVRSPELQEEIKSEIGKAVDGMFLLSQLHFDSIIGMRSPKAVRIALKRLPRGSNAYDRAYSEAMERIQRQVPSSQELAEQALSWITCARRPLATSELQHALAVEIGEPELDKENLPEIEGIVSVCAGLVTVDEESDIVRLAHYTTQEYFERTWTVWFPNAQTYIASNCVTYLSFTIFESGFCPTNNAFEERLRSNVLYDYAAQNWGHHARTASTKLERLILDFLESEAKVCASSQAMTAPSSIHKGRSQGFPKQMTGVHLAAHFGLRDPLMALLKAGYGPNVKDTYGRTPLSYAAHNGYEAVVKLLLEKGADIDFNASKNGQTPLSWAARNGHAAVVKLLLESGADINSKDSKGKAPLSWAAGNGHETVVRLLLEAGADIDSQNCHGWMPLRWAAKSENEAVVKLLLERGADIGSKDSRHGRVLLPCAAKMGYKVLVKLLLEMGADINSKDSKGQTPLSLATLNKDEAAVKLLLENGAEVNCKDFKGRTPLSWAMLNKHEALVKLLFENGADISSKESNHGTPLWWAAGNGYEEVVELLLERGADINSKESNHGYAPLWWAVANGHAGMVKLLLRNGADIDCKDSNGRTPLAWAAGNGHEMMVKLLQEHGAGVNVKGSGGQMAPLFWATLRSRAVA